MLILVAVTITMAVNGGLFEYAGRAGTQTNEAIANEQELANLQANMTVDDLINKYTQGSGETSGLVTFMLDGVEFTVAEGTRWMDWMKTVDVDELKEKGIKSVSLDIIGSINSFGEDQSLSISYGPPIGGGCDIVDSSTSFTVIAGGVIANGGKYEGNEF